MMPYSRDALTRLGHLIEEDGIAYMARSQSLDPDNVMAPLQAAPSPGALQRGRARGAKC